MGFGHGWAAGGMGLAYAVWLATPAYAQMPACAQGSQPAARAVCATPALAALDHQLGTILRSARSGAADAPTANLAADIEDDQAAWLRYRDRVCGDDPVLPLGLEEDKTSPDWRLTCLDQIYRDRLRHLQNPADQPGICREIIRQSPVVGTILQIDALRNLLAAWTHGRFKPVPDSFPDNSHQSTEQTGDNLLMRKTLRSDRHCETFSLSQKTPAGDIAVPAPGDVPADTASCQSAFNLAEINGISSLVEESAPSGRASFGLSFRQWDGRSWSQACSISAIFTPVNQVQRAFCTGDDCAALRALAVKTADIFTSPARAALWTSLPPAPWRDQWSALLRASRQVLPALTLPTLGADPDPEDVLSYVSNWYSADPPPKDGPAAQHLSNGDSGAIPVMVAGRLLLGKLGEAGIGCCRRTGGLLLSIYRLDRDRLQPVAGFVLRADTVKLEATN